MEAIEQVERNALIFFPTETIQDCRDSRDNKFLELAVEAKASYVITGDKDLLILNPFRNISTLTPADFLSVSVSQE
jgi:putative PIN family toxin of toxin-antitoxin system